MTTESVKTRTPTWRQGLARLRACEDAREWCEDYATLADAWKACERPDWMMWLVARTADGRRGGPAHRAITLLACSIARRVLHLVPEGELRPLQAIEAAERWARGEEEISREALYAFRDAAYAARSQAWDRYYTSRAAEAAVAAVVAEAAVAAVAAEAAVAAVAEAVAAEAAVAAVAEAVAAEAAERPVDYCRVRDEARAKFRREACDAIRAVYPEPPSLEVSR